VVSPKEKGEHGENLEMQCVTYTLANILDEMGNNHHLDAYKKMKVLIVELREIKKRMVEQGNLITQEFIRELVGVVPHYFQKELNQTKRELSK